MRFTVTLTLTLTLLIVGCGAGSNESGPAVGAMPDKNVPESSMGGPMDGLMGGVNTEVVLEPEIAAAWSGIRLHVVEYESGETEVIDVVLGETALLGGSGLTLSTSLFIPDFVMDEDGIKSRSAETHNPAARVVISEEGMANYEGWLFAAMPEIHPFPHDRFQVLLVEGIPSE